MNEKQYAAICDACDEVLNVEAATVERTAIPWLHVLREHPAFLGAYEELVKPASFRALLNRFGRSMRARFGLLRTLWRSVGSDGKAWHGPQTIDIPVDILFVSHLIDPAHAGQSRDFYFSDIPEAISETGLRPAVVLINHTNESSAALSMKWSEASIPHLVFSNTLSLRKEISLIARLRHESTRLRAHAKHQKPFVLRNVSIRAAAEAGGGQARSTLRMFEQLQLLINALRPQAVVVTYEGHAWERIAFAAARSVSEETLCLAYQHAAIFRLQHSIRRKLQPRFNPDLILAAGAVSKSQMERSPGLAGIPVLLLGSSRSFSATNVFDSERCFDDTQNTLHEDESGACLVLPEGIISECVLLFDFSLACAKLLPTTKFVWRLHPLVNFQRLVHAHPRFGILPKNVEVSSKALRADILRCKYALYRGSTSIVSAVREGLTPVYLMLPGEMTIDPLYELSAERKAVSTPAEFVATLLSKGSKDSGVARSYSERFYTPIDERLLKRIISEKLGTQVGM